MSGLPLNFISNDDHLMLFNSVYETKHFGTKFYRIKRQNIPGFETMIKIHSGLCLTMFGTIAKRKRELLVKAITLKV